MLFDVLSAFPEMLEGFIGSGLIAQAREKGLLRVGLWNLRDYAEPPHYDIDDRPYGGGPGMVLKPEPFFAGTRAIKAGRGGGHVILMSSRGELLTQSKLQELARMKNLILLCGRYEGVDERVTAICDEQLSLGDYVLLGGEVPAAAVIEGVARMVEGVVGNQRSVETDSFYDDNPLGPPQYTRPPCFEGMSVPEVLLSGDHEKIRAFRHKKALETTRRLRPDLLGEKED
ncbi:MAG: tRNA (guanosine(37)-N1)-methyltransferase TrmD [Candidatus Bipolaricaulota bacterium]